MKTITDEEQKDFFNKLSEYIMNEIGSIASSSNENKKRFLETIKNYGNNLDNGVYSYLQVKNDGINNKVAFGMITMAIGKAITVSGYSNDDYFSNYSKYIDDILIVSNDHKKESVYIQSIIIYLTNEFYKNYKK